MSKKRRKVISPLHKRELLLSKSQISLNKAENLVLKKRMADKKFGEEIQELQNLSAALIKQIQLTPDGSLKDELVSRNEEVLLRLDTLKQRVPAYFDLSYEYLELKINFAKMDIEMYTKSIESIKEKNAKVQEEMRVKMEAEKAKKEGGDAGDLSGSEVVK